MSRFTRSMVVREIRTGDAGVVTKIDGDGDVHAYWRYASSGWSSFAQWLHPDDIEPHPDPDPIWADYCAGVLRGEL